ncbi:MAG: universal stress protein UspA [Planctomycetaceae bacterium]|nr:universal stress protein UspA [Planctomycetaceae bacterium]
MSLLPKQTVVVPVDFAEESVNAISTALEFVERPSDIHAIHVMIPPNSMAPAALWKEALDEPHEKKTRRYFDEFLPKHGFAGLTVAVLDGDPGLRICDYAKEKAADLIVISSHGYHGVKRMLLGSTAERVVRHAECPVLVLRRSKAE